MYFVSPFESTFLFFLSNMKQKSLHSTIRSFSKRSFWKYSYWKKETRGYIIFLHLRLQLNVFRADIFMSQLSTFYGTVNSMCLPQRRRGKSYFKYILSYSSFARDNISCTHAVVVSRVIYSVKKLSA